MDETSLSPSARQALDMFREQTSARLARTPTDAAWRSALATAAPSRDGWVLKAAVLCVSCAVGAIVVTRLISAVAPEVRASPAAQWSREGDSLTVRRGQLRVQPRLKLAVATPHPQAVVQNAVVLFDVSENRTLLSVLSVESGEVAWRTPLRNGVLRGGETLSAGPVAPPPAILVLPQVPSVDGCARDADFENCLAREAEGSGLTAETALYAHALVAYERGEVADAARLFRSYAERFPLGVFAPEASIALMVALKHDGRSAEAKAEAARFSSRFANEPRAPEVARWGEQLP